MPSLTEAMKDYIQITFHAIGISIINDIDQEDLIYISLNPTKDMWTETRKFSVKPVTQKLNDAIEQHYKTYNKQNEENSNDQQSENKFKLDKNRVRIYYFNSNQIKSC
jgi:DNA-binding cell septation regulator SpoVG